MGLPTICSSVRPVCSTLQKSGIPCAPLVPRLGAFPITHSTVASRARYPTDPTKRQAHHRTAGTQTRPTAGRAIPHCHHCHHCHVCRQDHSHCLPGDCIAPFAVSLCPSSQSTASSVVHSFHSLRQGVPDLSLGSVPNQESAWILPSLPFLAARSSYGGTVPVQP